MTSAHPARFTKGAGKDRRRTAAPGQLLDRTEAGKPVPHPEDPSAAGAGPRIAEVRVARGLTVEQLSSRTYIRPDVIRDIESDDYRACGGACYARGQLRILGQALEVDVSTLTAAFDRAAGATGPETDRGTQPAPLLGRRLGRRTTLTRPLLAGLAVAVVICLLILLGVTP
jgi:cytoskeleton protein RodZ